MIRSADRHTRAHPCPVCNGHQNAPRGHGRRCAGFTQPDGPYIYCSREEYAGGAPFAADAFAYQHRRAGDCPCGAVHGTGSPHATVSTRKRKPEREEPAPLDADTLDRVHRAYLDGCPLRPEHRAFLAARGAADLAAAEAQGYGSLPATPAAARTLAGALARTFGAETLRRVPGFFAGGHAGELLTHHATEDYDAIVLPARDQSGRLLSLHRMTVRGTEAGHAKYQAFWGTHGAAGWLGAFPRFGRHEVRIVEGLHKAAVACALDGGAVYLALPGLALPDALLPALRDSGAEAVIECLDADKVRKPEVAAARAALQEKLCATGLPVETAVWDEADGNGLDDLLARGGRFAYTPVAAPAARAPNPRGPEPWQEHQCCWSERFEQFLRALAEALGDTIRLAGLKTSHIAAMIHRELLAPGLGGPPEEGPGVPYTTFGLWGGVSKETAGTHARALAGLPDAPYTIEKEPGGGKVFGPEAAGDRCYVSVRGDPIDGLRWLANLAGKRRAQGGRTDRVPEQVRCPEDPGHAVRKTRYTRYDCFECPPEAAFIGEERLHVERIKPIGPGLFDIARVDLNEQKATCPSGGDPAAWLVAAKLGERRLTTRAERFGYGPPRDERHVVLPDGDFLACTVCGGTSLWAPRGQGRPYRCRRCGHAVRLPRTGEGQVAPPENQGGATCPSVCSCCGAVTEFRPLWDGGPACCPECGSDAEGQVAPPEVA